MDNRKTGYPRGHTRRRLMVELVIGLVVLAVQRHSELPPFRHEELTPMPIALQAVAG
jgi:hypothetical protein